MGILGNGTQVDTILLEIITGTSTYLHRDIIEVLLTVKPHDTQSHHVIHKQITGLRIQTEGEVCIFAVSK